MEFFTLTGGVVASASSTGSTLDGGDFHTGPLSAQKHPGPIVNDTEHDNILKFVREQSSGGSTSSRP